MTPDIEYSNSVLTSRLIDHDPFFVSRCSDSVTKTSMYVDQRKNPTQSMVAQMKTHDGLYHTTNDQLIQLCGVYNKAISRADIMAIFPGLYENEQTYYLKKHPHIKTIHNRALEPFYIKSDEKWSKLLKNSRVLVVSSFVESYKQQLDSGFLLDNVWHDQQQFIFYKTFNTLAGNHIHTSSLETFNIMKQDITDIADQFDVALVSCGGYGLPLCDHIHTQLKKTSIYVGGALQLLFGVLGNRWVNNTVVGSLLNGYKGFIRPKEIPNQQLIESGCYW